MSNKYKGKYRNKSLRLQSWDYGWDAAYFVTICTRNRKCYFGEIVTGKMHLSEVGKLAEKYWKEIPLHFPYAILGAFVIMPDHMHGIIIIDKAGINSGIGSGIAINRDPTAYSAVNLSDGKGGVTGHKNPMLHQNLSRIIRWYKGRVTFESRKVCADFAWQSLFYDHIIRDEISYHFIHHYILDNVKNWDQNKRKI